MSKTDQRDQKRFGGPLFGPKRVDLSPFTLPTSQLHEALAAAFDGEPRYIVIGCLEVEDDRFEASMWHTIHLYKTLKNSIRSAVEGPAYARLFDDGSPRMQRSSRGAVLQFDLRRLPVIDLNNPQPFCFKEDDELSFAERQFEWWGKRVIELTASHKVNKETRKP